MNKQEILAKIKSLVTMNFATDSGDGDGNDPKPAEPTTNTISLEVEEEVDGEVVKVTYELVYEGELEVGSKVTVSKDGEAVESYSGDPPPENEDVVVITDNEVTEINVKEEDESEGETEDPFMAEFSAEVINKFSAINETLEEVIGKFKASEEENKALKTEIAELNEKVIKFSKQEVDKRKPKTYTSREEFMKNPKIINDLK